MKDFLLALLAIWFIGYIINVVLCTRSMIKKWGWHEVRRDKKSIAWIILTGMLFWPFYYGSVALWALRDMKSADPHKDVMRPARKLEPLEEYKRREM